MSVSVNLDAFRAWSAAIDCLANEDEETVNEFKMSLKKFKVLMDEKCNEECHAGLGLALVGHLHSKLAPESLDIHSEGEMLMKE